MQLTDEQKRRIDESERWPVRMEVLIDHDEVTFAVSVGGTQDTDNGRGIWSESGPIGSDLIMQLELDMNEVAGAVLLYIKAGG